MKQYLNTHSFNSTWEHTWESELVWYAIKVSPPAKENFVENKENLKTIIIYLSWKADTKGG